MKCGKCKRQFVIYSVSAGETWHLYVCSHCGWKHYTGYHFPFEAMWQDVKDGKASIDLGPHHRIGKNALQIGGNAGKTMTGMENYPCTQIIGYVGYVCGFCGKPVPEVKNEKTGDFYSFIACNNCANARCVPPVFESHGDWKCMGCGKHYDMDGIGYSNPSYCPECTNEKIHGEKKMEIKCHNCNKMFNQTMASSGAGTTWNVYICPSCGWHHYTGYLMPDNAVWENIKSGKASGDFGPHHRLCNVFLGPSAGFAIRHNGDKKVYCQTCKYILQADPNRTVGIPIPGEPAGVGCGAPKNIESESHDTWFQSVKSVTRKQLPKDINKNNDCPWYV